MGTELVSEMLNVCCVDEAESAEELGRIIAYERVNNDTEDNKLACWLCDMEEDTGSELLLEL